MKRDVVLSSYIESRELRRMQFIKADTIESLDLLVDQARGPVDWNKIRQSWVVSQRLRGETRIMTIKNGIVEDISEDVRLLSRVNMDYDVQMEIIEDDGIDYCVDVMFRNGIDLTQMPLNERLGYIPRSLESVMGICKQNYYPYNQNTIQALQENNVVDYVIQNMLDPYNCQMRRYTSLIIDGMELTDTDYANESLSFKKQAEYEQNDLEEKIEIRNNKKWNTHVIRQRKLTLLTKPVKVYREQLELAQRAFDMLTINKQRNIRYKRRFHTVRQVVNDQAISYVNILRVYDVADRVLEK
jgi:hypothetical protein